jgi:hypothetical protein
MRAHVQGKAQVKRKQDDILGVKPPAVMQSDCDSDSDSDSDSESDSECLVDSVGLCETCSCVK